MKKEFLWEVVWCSDYWFLMSFWSCWLHSVDTPKVAHNKPKNKKLNLPCLFILLFSSVDIDPVHISSIPKTSMFVVKHFMLTRKLLDILICSYNMPQDKLVPLELHIIEVVSNFQSKYTTGILSPNPHLLFTMNTWRKNYLLPLYFCLGHIFHLGFFYQASLPGVFTIFIHEFLRNGTMR